MPEALREILERNEQERDKMHIKALHAATTSLGKAKRTLAEVADARRSHRVAWMKHLNESIQIWEKQLADFRKQQAVFQEQAMTATEEASRAKRTIHNLNTGGKGDVPVSDEEELSPEATPDQEEEKLRGQLSVIYKAFAGSLGAVVPPLAVATTIPDDSDSDLVEKEGNKRPCVESRAS